MRIGLVVAAAFSLLLLAASGVHAADGGGAVAPPPPPPTPSRAPIGAPPALNNDEINNAYEFRNKMSSDPICQDLARQSDAVYADPEVESDKKPQKLEQIRSRAKSAGCI